MTKSLATRKNSHFAKKSKNAHLCAIGTGLIALDIVINIQEKGGPWMWAGGTCGNVLTILSYLGWQAFPVARLNGDSASKCVEEDLLQWGVNLDFARTEPGSRTPIIVQRISKSKGGNPIHRFSWTCPNCGAWLPGYQPILAKAAQNIVAKIGKPSRLIGCRISKDAFLI